MSETVKRVLLIVGLLAVAGLIGYGIYYFAIVRPSQEDVAPGEVVTPGTGTGLPTAPRRTSTVDVGTPTTPVTPGTGGTTVPTTPGGAFYQPTPVRQLASTTPSFLSITPSGRARYHDLTNGKFYRILPDGSVRALSDKEFFNVQSVTWAPSSDKAVITYPDGFKTLYNFETQRQVTLPEHWTDFSFSPDGSQIAAKSLGLSRENRWLVTFNDDGTGTQLIEPLGDFADRVTVSWSPSRQTVAFSQTGEPIGYDRRQILLIGQRGENFKPLTVEGLNFQPSWSPTGRKLLYSIDSVRTNFKPELWITDAYGDSIDNNRQSLKLNTWANKCAFGGDDTTLFCAVPRELPDGAGLSPELAMASADDVFKIDLKTGSRSVINLGEQDYRIANINFDRQSNRLIFTDVGFGGVFQVGLTE